MVSSVFLKMRSSVITLISCSFLREIRKDQHIIDEMEFPTTSLLQDKYQYTDNFFGTCIETRHLASAALSSERSNILCPQTKSAAKCVVETATDGLKIMSGLSDQDVSVCKASITRENENLQRCLDDQTLYSDLIAEVRQFYQQHYVAKYLGPDLDRNEIHEKLIELYGGDENAIQVPLAVGNKKNNNWAHIIAKMNDEVRKAPEEGYNDTSSRRSAMPATGIVERIAELFEEDFDTFVRIVSDLTEETDEYEELDGQACFSELVRHMGSDKKLLEVRLGEPGDRAFREVITRAMDGKLKRLFLRLYAEPARDARWKTASLHDVDVASVKGVAT
ncbi:hypothetical protein CTRI78_v003310 [Colletotrichum trifolii]|uniref:Uncharacterized protein n=1 Tax=Colletotrichum trifolii TaxID=5466 RepID=A0A4R8RJT7_COLTR|nr:hypothetical protein CTRI78_v003310 [Colletotrichum trifolii]